MRLEALGWSVLVKMDPVKTSHDLGNGKMLEIPMTEEEKRRHEASQMTGEIVDIGPLAWRTRHFKPIDGSEAEPWAKVGDRVTYSKFGGKIIQDPDNDKQQYMLLQDEDIKCKVKEK